MSRINRRPAAVRRTPSVNPHKEASGSIAEEYRSSILGAPEEFRDSKFDPDRATLDELKARSGEIAKLMAPAPEELAFSDTGTIRDIFRQPESSAILEPPEGFMGGFPPPGFGEPGGLSTPPRVGGHMIGKALTTGRILREHPDKFKSAGEAGGRFFKRIPAIKRRIDLDTAYRDMPDTGPYGTPGGMKFIDEIDYLGRSDDDPFFMGI